MSSICNKHFLHLHRLYSALLPQGRNSRTHFLAVPDNLKPAEFKIKMPYTLEYEAKPPLWGSTRALTKDPKEFCFVF